jgi:Immunoglobulin-like domain of bacterial spore germination
MIKAMYVFIALALVAAFAGIFLSNYATAPNESDVPTPKPVAVMCTADALKCPDGSFVGRTGADCAFVCPAVSMQDTSNQVKVIVPNAEAVVTSPLTITGEARGPWYFEASFPVELQNSEGVVIATAIATATGDWMTTEFVPFTTTLQFVNPYKTGQAESFKNGVLVFKKDNPSGESQNDVAHKVPIRFAP